MATLQKGYFKNTSSGKIVNFMFNPTSIDTSRDASYNVIQGCGASYPKFQYVGGSEESISFKLFLYGDPNTIKSHVSFLESVMPNKNPKARFSVPPTVLFSFGGSFTEECVLIQLKKSHLGFDANLNTNHMEINIELVVVK